MFRTKFFAAAFLAVLVVQSASAQVVTFTGADPGEGLDFQGVFPYALFKNDGGISVTVGNATFTPDNATPGVTITGWPGPSFIDNWVFPNYASPTLDDNNLKSVMNSVRHTGALPGTGNIDLTVVPGTAYKLQMMWHENSNFPLPRIFDIFVEGVLAADDFTTGSAALNPTSGKALIYEFVAVDSNIDIDLIGVSGSPDSNPTFFALTLEAVPEPSTYALGCLGIVSLIVLRRRK